MSSITLRLPALNFHRWDLRICDPEYNALLLQLCAPNCTNEHHTHRCMFREIFPSAGILSWRSLNRPCTFQCHPTNIPHRDVRGWADAGRAYHQSFGVIIPPNTPYLLNTIRSSPPHRTTPTSYPPRTPFVPNAFLTIAASISDQETNIAIFVVSTSRYICTRMCNCAITVTIEGHREIVTLALSKNSHFCVQSRTLTLNHVYDTLSATLSKHNCCRRQLPRGPRMAEKV